MLNYLKHLKNKFFPKKKAKEINVERLLPIVNQVQKIIAQLKEKVSDDYQLQLDYTGSFMIVDTRSSEVVVAAIANKQTHKYHLLFNALIELSKESAAISRIINQEAGVESQENRPLALDPESKVLLTDNEARAYYEKHFGPTTTGTNHPLH